MQLVLRILPLSLRFGCGLLRLFRGLALGGFFLLLCSGSSALVELVDATGRIDQFLLTGEQRMTRRANFDGDLFQGRAGGKCVSASTVNPSLGIPVRMDLLFHSPMIIARGRKRGDLLRPKESIGC